MDKIRFFELVTEWFEVLGVVAMVLGFVFAFVIAGRAWSRTRDGSSAFRTLRETMGAVILLGLEILVAADLVKDGDVVAVADRRRSSGHDRSY